MELLPIHQFVTDKHLHDRGLSNYWGYNSIGFFAPEIRYASSRQLAGQVAEFKTTVKKLHEVGIEVILDVVYNHTAEGNQLGPTLCFRGIDNASYYRLADQRRHYMDYTGTGNTLNMMHPRTLQLIMDSLRYWILEMHVDGFRFDLASTLARELHDVDRLGSFFDIIQQDPVISQVKLIAEPWDLGEGGYQVGNFPALWAEWNGLYRDTVRAFWKGDEGQAGVFASRLTGSSDLYGRGGRRPYASINFVTAHDGFTLHDLVTYNDKHNEANGEDNRDGADHNLSWNCGVEGPSTDPAIVALRERQKRNFLATLLLSQGVPMLSGGDEIGRTQGGNNNAYAQDNETSWYAWPLEGPARALLRFTRHLIGVAHTASGAAPSAVLLRPQDSRLGGEGSVLVSPRRQGDERRRLERLHALLRPAAGRRRHRRRRHPRPARCRRHVASAHQCPLGANRLRLAGPSALRTLGTAAGHTRSRWSASAPTVPGRADLRARGAFSGPLPSRTDPSFLSMPTLPWRPWMPSSEGIDSCLTAFMNNLAKRIGPWLQVVAIVLMVGILYFGQAILVPIAVAGLFTFLLSPVVAFLQRYLGRVAAVLVAVTLSFSAMGAIAWSVAGELRALAHELPTYRHTIRQRIVDLRGASRGSAVEKVQETVKDIKEAIQSEASPKGREKPVAVKTVETTPDLWGFPTAVGPLLDALATAGLVVILAVFMLLEQQELRNRIISLVGSGRVSRATMALDEAGSRISRYLFRQSIINGIFGLGIGIGLALLGVPHAVLWGLLAAMLRFVPYIGPWIAALAPIALSLAVFPGWVRPLLVAALFVVFELFTNIVLETLLYAGAAGVSQVGLLVAIAFWTWIWGPAGLLMATPLTVCLVVLARHVPSMEFLATLAG